MGNFVRRVLRCSCPDEVLRDIRMETPPPDLAGLPVERMLAVGGRLLVLICDSDYRPTNGSELRRLGAQALKLRDARGFNRVRIVLVADDAPTPDWALSLFPALDDRLHWHRVPLAELASIGAR